MPGTPSGLPNLHSHAFQRGMAGPSEVRGPGTGSLWTWREVMYPFLGRMTPDDVEAVAAHHPALAERHGDALLDGWSFGAASPTISAVSARGRQVVAGGQHAARASIAQTFRLALRRLLA